MSTKFQAFKDLHRANELFILPNVWNAKSAQTFEKEKFPAVATSSSAVAESLGYEDGEGMPFEDYLFVIRRIIASVTIPLSVDVEMGYPGDHASGPGRFGNPDDFIAQNIVRLAELGVAGINIEDSIITPGGRKLDDPERFAKTIDTVRRALTAKHLDLFINLRCDTYLLDVPGKQEETQRRLKLYENAGADGIFLPCITEPQDIEEAVRHTRLAVNVMSMPGLPDFDTLKKLGVQRVSMGAFLFENIYGKAAQLSKAILTQNNFSPLFK